MNDLRSAQLQDVKANSLMPVIPNPLAMEAEGFLVEYGVRIDDQAMVFHFFSPKDAATWDEKYRMDARLKRAIDSNFDTRKITCGYVREMDSFYVIVGGLGSGPDPWPLAERFLRDVESPLEGSS